MSTKKGKLRLFVQKGEGEINIKVDWVFPYVFFFILVHINTTYWYKL